MDFTFILLLIAMFGAMYFLMIRPQKKRAAEQQALIDAMGAGDRVVLTSGIFVTILHMGDRQAVVEVAPGVELTVLRQAIVRGVAEDEDEFEYTDEAGEVPVDAEPSIGTDPQGSTPAS